MDRKSLPIEELSAAKDIQKTLDDAAITLRAFLVLIAPNIIDGRPYQFNTEDTFEFLLSILVMIDSARGKLLRERQTLLKEVCSVSIMEEYVLAEAKATIRVDETNGKQCPEESTQIPYTKDQENISQQGPGNESQHDDILKITNNTQQGVVIQSEDLNQQGTDTESPTDVFAEQYPETESSAEVATQQDSGTESQKEDHSQPGSLLESQTYDVTQESIETMSPDQTVTQPDIGDERQTNDINQEDQVTSSQNKDDIQQSPFIKNPAVTATQPTLSTENQSGDITRTGQDKNQQLENGDFSSAVNQQIENYGNTSTVLRLTRHSDGTVEDSINTESKSQCQKAIITTDTVRCLTRTEVVKSKHRPSHKTKRAPEPPELFSCRITGDKTCKEEDLKPSAIGHIAKEDDNPASLSTPQMQSTLHQVFENMHESETENATRHGPMTDQNPDVTQTSQDKDLPLNHENDHFSVNNQVEYYEMCDTSTVLMSTKKSEDNYEERSNTSQCQQSTQRITTDKTVRCPAPVKPKRHPSHKTKRAPEPPNPVYIKTTGQETSEENLTPSISIITVNVDDNCGSSSAQNIQFQSLNLEQEHYPVHLNPFGNESEDENDAVGDALNSTSTFDCKYLQPATAINDNKYCNAKEYSTHIDVRNTMTNIVKHNTPSCQTRGDYPIHMNPFGDESEDEYDIIGDALKSTSTFDCKYLQLATAMNDKSCNAIEYSTHIDVRNTMTKLVKRSKPSCQNGGDYPVHMNPFGDDGDDECGENDDEGNDNDTNTAYAVINKASCNVEGSPPDVDIGNVRNIRLLGNVDAVDAEGYYETIAKHGQEQKQPKMRRSLTELRNFMIRPFRTCFGQKTKTDQV